MEGHVLVGMGEMQVVEGSALITCHGLGSCLAVFAADPAANLAAMAHVMLPSSFPRKPMLKEGKFVDTAIPALLRDMEALGAKRERIVFIYAGGAQVFEISPQFAHLDIGARNIAALKACLRRHGARVIAFDAGGTLGRTLTVDTGTGAVQVRTTLGGIRQLCNYRNLGGLRSA